MKKYNLSSYFQSLILLLFSFCTFSVFGQTTNYTGQSNKPITTTATNLGVLNPPDENREHRTNFVRTYSAQVSIQSMRDMRNQPIEKVVVTTGYMDGLGRMIQSNMREASPSKKDIIQVANYDQYGRQAKQYLPFTKENGGRYETSGLTQQYLFYRNEPNITHTNYAFIEADIENSPMARMNEVGNVGEHWKLGNGHTRSATTRTNTADDKVRKWKFENACTINGNEIYEKFQLYVSEVKDEDGTRIQTFIDKTGKTILKRVEGENSEWLETYYLYDNYSRLYIILPPEMTKLISTQNYTHNDICRGYGAFVYQYDTRGRLVSKHTPGKLKTTTNIFYDKLDRPVFVQTPEQQQRQEYSFTKYDKFNRPVLSGILKGVYLSSQTVMQETVLFEERNQNENTHFYTHRTFQNIRGTYEIHTVTYYDDYEFLETHPDSVNAPFRFRTPPMNEAARPTYKVKGMATGSKVLLLQDDPLLISGFQTSVIYYDDYGRPIQVQKENHKNGLDVSYTKYDFAGKVLETVTKHETDVHELKVRYEYTYDHVGRPLEVKQRIQTPTTSNIATPNQDREKIISRYHYNELGQVTQKQLHSENDGVTFLQDVDFKYNVRGWLTHINDSELTDTRDVFGMELSYETGFEEVQHNGNISGVKWKSTTNNVERSYGFAYDKLGRLKRANFHAKDETTGKWTAENENYTVWDLNYDLDGNILSVKRNGLLKEDGQTKVFGLIDDLKYEYRRIDNRGLMLMGVEDGANFETASKDFKDGNRGDDYSYNYEGSIVSDKNKGVSFEYNHLGRVNKILNTANPSDKIDYLYDATGSKLQKTVKEGARTKKIDYVNGFQYRNDSLDFFPMPEGRIVFKDGEYIPEYHFKDHLGNLRLAFQVTDRQNARYALTMETDSAETEEKEFENVKVARTDLKEQKGAYSARLTNADKAISKTIKVEKGDKISAAVFATNDPEIAQTDPNKAIATAKKDILLSLGAAAAGTITVNPTQQEIEIPLNPEISPARTETIKAPRVRLNLLGFVPVIRNLRELKRAKRAKSLEPDSYHVPRGELVLQLRDSTDSLLVEKREKITISATISWQKLLSEFTAEEDGNLTVFIDNSDTEAVYFDELELRVERQPTLVITQEHHYYPFGMNMSGIERDGELKYQFNGMVEKEEAFGLELYETPFRSYDAQLGRFWQVEPLADEFHSISMFQFAFNNPVSFNDPTGLSSDTGSGTNKKEEEKQPTPTPNGDPNYNPIRDPGRIGGGTNIGGSGSKIGAGGHTWDLGNNRGVPSMGGTPGSAPGRGGYMSLSSRNTKAGNINVAYTKATSRSTKSGGWQELTSSKWDEITGETETISGRLFESIWTAWALSSTAFTSLQYRALKKGEERYHSDKWNKDTEFDGRSLGFDLELNFNRGTTNINTGVSFYEAKRTNKNKIFMNFKKFQLPAHIDIISTQFSDAVTNRAAFYSFITTANVTDVSVISEYADKRNVIFSHYVAYYRAISGTYYIKFKARQVWFGINVDLDIRGGNNSVGIPFIK